MSGAWPPAPDLESIQELVRDADVEGLIAGGAPGDEYEPEGEAMFRAIAHLATVEITSSRLLALLESIWGDSFSANDAELALRRPALLRLAGQIERFFGPEAVPRRGS